jgi:hypothetical protein
MTDIDDPFVSRDLSIRREQQRNLKTSQQKKMEFRQINRDANSFHQSVAATNHQYMKNELLKEKQSKVTFPDELLRIHGNFTATNR